MQLKQQNHWRNVPHVCGLWSLKVSAMARMAVLPYVSGVAVRSDAWLKNRILKKPPPRTNCKLQ